MVLFLLVRIRGCCFRILGIIIVIGSIYRVFQTPIVLHVEDEKRDEKTRVQSLKPFADMRSAQIGQAG